MPDTGAPWEIPFLDGTELVRAYPAFSEDLAEQIADGLTDASLIKQVVQTVKTDAFTANVAQGSVSGDVTGLTRSITPSSVSSKILVLFSVALGVEDGSGSPRCVLYRDGSPTLYVGDATGNQMAMSAGVFSDSGRSIPAAVGVFIDQPNTTSSVTYSIRVGHETTGTRSVYVNRGRVDDNSDRTMRVPSSLTCVEVAA